MTDRELDALIAERVMGFSVIETDDCNGVDNYWLSADGVRPLCWPTGIDRQLPEYATDMAAAWTVVEKMVGQGFDFGTFNSDPGVFGVAFRGPSGSSESASGPMPRAICLAALKTVAE